MNDLIITIGRENGSGGREIGRILAEKLGVKCYDQEIVAEAAIKSGLTQEEVLKNEENNRLTSLSFYGIPAPNPVFVAQSDAIRELASKGPCVFVGRCADEVLRNRKNTINVFIHAPIESRVERSSKRNNISEKDALARVNNKDRERATYYQRYTGKIWGSSSHYHLSVDTGEIGVENAADLIITYVKMTGRK